MLRLLGRMDSARVAWLAPGLGLEEGADESWKGTASAVPIRSINDRL